MQCSEVVSRDKIFVQVPRPRAYIYLQSPLWIYIYVRLVSEWWHSARVVLS